MVWDFCVPFCGMGLIVPTIRKPHKKSGEPTDTRKLFDFIFTSNYSRKSAQNEEIPTSKFRNLPMGI